MTLAVGLMSGTSGDGVSAVLASFKNRSFRLIAYETYPYPKSAREKITRPFNLKTREISELNAQLGEILAASALKIMRRSKTGSRKISVIGSHGQTLYHGPEDKFPSTFQIGEPAVIAQRTKIPVVSDFRPQDIAAGGEGAPLIPFFDHYFYGHGPVRAFQNIGGIANVTVVGRGLKNPVAFDTGPGNCLMDLAIQRITKGRLLFDRSGKWAAKGCVEMKWIETMACHPYFKRRPPKSTGREKFNERFLNKYLGENFKKRPSDLLATLTYFTAFTIHQGLKRFAPAHLKELVVSGGGALNQTLMDHLKGLFSPTRVLTMEEFGVPPQAKEPLAFAFFALRALRRQTNHLPSTTGATHPVILGKITNV